MTQHVLLTYEHFLNFGNRPRRIVIFTYRPVYPGENSLNYPLFSRMGRPHTNLNYVQKNSFWESKPHPTVVQSVPCLLYCCSFLTELQQLSFCTTVAFLQYYCSFLTELQQLSLCFTVAFLLYYCSFPGLYCHVVWMNRILLHNMSQQYQLCYQERDKT